jgi:hypothetical protein
MRPSDQKTGQTTCYLNRTYHVLATAFALGLDISALKSEILTMRPNANRQSKAPAALRMKSFIDGFVDGLGAPANLFSFLSNPHAPPSKASDVGSPAQAWADAFKFIHFGHKGVANHVAGTQGRKPSANRRSA